MHDLTYSDVFLVPEPLGGHQPARRRPRPGRRHRRDHPDRLGEHELGHRPAPGRDPGPPRRARRAAAGHAPAGAGCRHPLGEGPAGRLRHPAHARRRATPSPTRCGCCPPSRATASSCTTAAASTSAAIPAVAARHRAARRPARRPAARRARLARRRRRRRTARGVRPDGRRRPRVRARAAPRRGRRHAQPHERAALDALPAGASTRDGRLRVAAAVGINGDVAAQGDGARRRRASTCSCSTRRTATRRACCARSRRSPPSGLGIPIVAGNVVTAEARARPGRAPAPTSSRSASAPARCARPA